MWLSQPEAFLQLPFLQCASALCTPDFWLWIPESLWLEYNWELRERRAVVWSRVYTLHSAKELLNLYQKRLKTTNPEDKMFLFRRNLVFEPGGCLLLHLVVGFFLPYTSYSGSIRTLHSFLAHIVLCVNLCAFARVSLRIHSSKTYLFFQEGFLAFLTFR